MYFMASSSTNVSHVENNLKSVVDGEGVARKQIIVGSLDIMNSKVFLQFLRTRIHRLDRQAPSYASSSSALDLLSLEPSP